MLTSLPNEFSTSVWNFDDFIIGSFIIRLNQAQVIRHVVDHLPVPKDRLTNFLKLAILFVK